VATEFDIVRTQASTGGGTQDITSTRITDFSAAIVFIYGVTSSGSPADTARLGVGFATAAGEGFSMAGQARDNQAALGGNVGLGSSTACVALNNNTANNGQRSAVATVVARATSGLANGFRITWTTTPDAAYEMVVVLFGGLANAALRSLSSSTNFGFQVDAGFVINPSGFSGGDGTAGNDACCNLGFFTNKSAILQVSHGQEWDRNVASNPISTDADARVSSNRASISVSAGTASSGANVTAIGATTVSVTNAEGRCLGIEFADNPTWGCALESIPSSTGVSPFTALGFDPDLVLGMATLLDATDTTTDGATSSTAGTFAFDQRGNAFAGSFRAQEGIALTTAGGAATGNVTDTSTRFDAGSCISVMNHTGSVTAAATDMGRVGGGFSLNFSAAPGGRMVIFGLALVPHPLVRAPRRRRARRVQRGRWRRITALAGGRPPGGQPLVRMWQAILRQRRLLRDRLVRRPPFLPPQAAQVGEELEESSNLRVSSPGLIRGTVIGPGVASPEVDL